MPSTPQQFVAGLFKQAAQRKQAAGFGGQAGQNVFKGPPAAPQPAPPKPFGGFGEINKGYTRQTVPTQPYGNNNIFMLAPPRDTRHEAAPRSLPIDRETKLTAPQEQFRNYIANGLNPGPPGRFTSSSGYSAASPGVVSGYHGYNQQTLQNEDIPDIPGIEPRELLDYKQDLVDTYSPRSVRIFPFRDDDVQALRSQTFGERNPLRPRIKEDGELRKLDGDPRMDAGEIAPPAYPGLIEPLNPSYSTWRSQPYQDLSSPDRSVTINRTTTPAFAAKLKHILQYGDPNAPAQAPPVDFDRIDTMRPYSVYPPR